MKRAVLQLAIATLLLAAARPAVAAKSYRAEAYRTEIEILANGDLRVTERTRFRFIGGPFTENWRTLPQRDTDGITVESGSDSIQVFRGRSLRVVWRYPACADTTRDFLLTYRVRGALQQDGDRRVLDWNAFPVQRRYGIRDATVQVTWPASWPEPLRVESRRTKSVAAQGAHSALFHADDVARDRTLRVRVEFPAAGIAAPEPAWQIREGERTQQLVLGLAIAIGFVALGSTLVLVLYREMAPHRPRAVPRSNRPSAPPSDLPAAVAGVLAAGSAQFQHLIAAVAALAAGGQLGFEAALSKRWWGGGQFVLRRGKPGISRGAWEQALLDSLARVEESGTTAWPKALAALRRGFLGFKTAIYAELQRRGDFDPQAGERARPLHTVALVAGLLALACFALAAVQWTTRGPVALLPGIGLMVVMVIAMAKAASFPRYTAAGAQHALAWRSFGAHLKDLAKRQQPLDAEKFQAWLPYALALGVAGEWIQAGKKSKLPVPLWFQVPGAEGMAGFAAIFAATSSSGAGGAASSGGAGGGGSGAH